MRLWAAFGLVLLLGMSRPAQVWADPPPGQGNSDCSQPDDHGKGDEHRRCPKPTGAPTETPLATPTPTSTPRPTRTPTTAPTSEPTAEPTAESTAGAVATPTSTAISTVQPTATSSTPPTISATLSPTPTLTPTPWPTPIAIGQTNRLDQQIIPFSDPEIANPDRGQYAWYGQLPVPDGTPWIDSYWRWGWADLESCEGCYDFSAIDAKLAEAREHGGRFGFSISSVSSGADFLGPDYSVMPEYVRANSNSWLASGNETTFWVPDWNSDFYLTRFEALMRALGERYGDDPRLGFFDMSGYGNWSEWHNWPYFDGPAGQTSITDANVRRLVDANVNVFARAYVLALTDHPYELQYALGLSSTHVGLRNNCIGQSALGGDVNTMNSVPGVLERWKTAPFITEWCGNTGAQGIVNMDAQVQQYHLSMLGCTQCTDRSLDPATYDHGTKSLGYRYQLDSVTVPQAIARAVSFSIQGRWENVGMAPAYRPWNTRYQLRSAGAVVWEGASGVDLRSILPTNGAPVVRSDALLLPSSVAPGDYDLAIQFTDPDGITQPLALAIDGRQADGSYLLGTVTVI
jgi:hypothetical protein